MRYLKLRLVFILIFLIGVFIILSGIYRSDVAALHGALFRAVRSGEILHCIETFHSSLHFMLLTLSGNTKTADTASLKAIYTEQRAAGTKALERLLSSAHGDEDEQGKHIIDRLDDPAGGRSIRLLYGDFLRETEWVLQSSGEQRKKHLAAASALFDQIFSGLNRLHAEHDSQMLSLAADAHAIKKRTDLFFLIQLFVILTTSGLLVLFADKVLIRMFRMTEKHALTDGLTGLHNRRYLDISVPPLFIDHAGKDAPIALILIDLDHFKSFNDTYGHPAGDKLLRDAASLLTQSVRETDRIVRYGGEEFLVILPGAKRNAAIAIAEKIRLQIEACEFILPTGEPAGRVTASLGIASLPEDGVNYEKVVKRADERLYQAKNEGRNKAC